MIVAVTVIGFVLVLTLMLIGFLGLEKDLQKIEDAIYSLESTVKGLDPERFYG